MLTTPSRTVRLSLPLNAEGQNGIVCITDERGPMDYLCDRVPASKGSRYSFQIRLQECVSGANYLTRFFGSLGTCTCLQGSRGGDCRHLLAVRALRKAGKL